MKKFYVIWDTRNNEFLFNNKSYSYGKSIFTTISSAKNYFNSRFDLKFRNIEDLHRYENFLHEKDIKPDFLKTNPRKLESFNNQTRYEVREVKLSLLNE